MNRRLLRPLPLGLVVAGSVALLAAGGSVGAQAPRSAAPTHAAAAAAKPPKVPSAVASTPAGAVTDFGVNLMPLVGGRGNMVFSPYSIATVIAMAGVGASGATATQIAHVLDVASPSRIAGVGTLSATFKSEQATAGAGDPNAPILDLANGLFLQQGFAVRSAFTSALTSGFGAPPQLVDFESDPGAATAAINEFVSEHTMGVIPSILSPGMISASTRLALANAIYLKARWLHPFPASATANATFHAPAGARQVPFMSETASLSYAKESGYQAVELPYEASTFAMLVLDPAGNEAAFEKTVTPALIAKSLAAVKPTEVALKLPRFHISLMASLAPALEHLGMSDAFDPRVATFSGISSTPLFLAFVEHEADFTVDETGTIAVAATVGGISTSAVEAPPRPTVTVDLNEPFPFYLVDTKTGAVIFAGRLTDPSTAATPAG